jgi:hypothetical protein
MPVRGGERHRRGETVHVARHQHLWLRGDALVGFERHRDELRGRRGSREDVGLWRRVRGGGGPGPFGMQGHRRPRAVGRMGGAGRPVEHRRRQHIAPRSDVLDALLSAHRSARGRGADRPGPHARSERSVATARAPRGHRARRRNARPAASGGS